MADDTKNTILKKLENASGSTDDIIFTAIFGPTLFTPTNILKISLLEIPFLL